MGAGSIPLKLTARNSWRVAVAGLVLAALIVGVAVTVGGSTARALNGIGAVVWLASAVLLALTLPVASNRFWGWTAAIVTGVLLGGVIRPGILSEAFIWFFLAGAVVVIAAGDRSGGWALLAPAIYLPVHLAVGIGRAIVRNGGIRTEPPPTAAILPLVIVLATALAGALAAAYVRRARGS